VEIRPASDCSLLVSFGDTISMDAHCQVRRLVSTLRAAPAGILNLHPAYTSVLIDFDPRRRSHEDMEALLRERMLLPREAADTESRTVEIPVSYGGAWGPDLEEVARHAGVTPARVVELHAAARYVVFFLGFSPGFPYLGGLPPELSAPRLATPRRRVPAGSVAIGGSHTGIYPVESPGGWRLIGRTALRLFDPEASPPALLRMGDEVRFVPV
jgi:KipI family sensor histidine kinase inhibitor